MDGATLKALTRELFQLKTDEPEGIKVTINEEKLTEFTVTMDGPDGTPYQGGQFKIGVVITDEYPSVPPKCTFITKIFHPNVSKIGEICVNTLKKDWRREYGIKHALLTIKCLLIVPNAESALNEEAGRLILEDYEAFTERAKLLTSIHAKPVISSTERKSGPDSSRNSSENSTENTVASNITGPESSSPRKRPQTDTKKVDAKKKTLKRL